MRIVSDTTKRAAKCRSCLEKIEKGEKGVAIREMYASGKSFDLWFHWYCFDDMIAEVAEDRWEKKT